MGCKGGMSAQQRVDHAVAMILGSTGPKPWAYKWRADLSMFSFRTLRIAIQVGLQRVVSNCAPTLFY